MIRTFVGIGLAGLLLCRPATADERQPRFKPGEGQSAIATGFPLIFDSEWIRLAIVGDSLEVRGTYYLYCRKPIRSPLPLTYPFPKDSLLGGARMVSLNTRIAGGPATPGRWDETALSGVRWWMPPCGGDTITLESVYRQKLRSEYARYIVTTTRHWDRPLRRARFEIRLPPGSEPLRFSYPFVRRENGADVFYSFEAEKFFPDTDIIVTWRERRR